MAVDIKISIPKQLIEKLEKKIKQTDFKSVEEYVIYILNQVASEQTESENKAYSKEEETQLKKELSDMGYL